MTGIDRLVDGAWRNVARPDMAYAVAYARMQAMVDAAGGDWRAYRLCGMGTYNPAPAR